MKVLMTFEVDDDLDLEDVYVDFKLFKGDDCIQLECGMPVRKAPQQLNPNEVIALSTSREINLGYMLGFNACVDEVIGEAE